MDTNFEVFISDFGKCLFHNTSTFIEKPLSNHLLMINLIKTLNECVKLLKNTEEKILFRQIIDQMQNDYHNYIYEEQKILSSFYRGTRDLERYKDDVINN